MHLATFASGLAPAASGAALVQGSPGAQDLWDYFRGTALLFTLPEQTGADIVLVPTEPQRAVPLW